MNNLMNTLMNNFCTTYEQLYERLMNNLWTTYEQLLWCINTLIFTLKALQGGGYEQLYEQLMKKLMSNFMDKFMNNLWATLWTTYEQLYEQLMNNFARPLLGAIGRWFEFLFFETLPS